MNRLERLAFERLESVGIFLDSRNDFDLVLRIHTLAEAALVSSPLSALDAVRLPTMSVGGATFSRMSIGADEFREDFVVPWFDADPKILNLSIAYLMAHTKDPAQIWEYRDRPDAFRQAVKAWAAGLTCPYRVLIRTVQAFVAYIEDEDDLDEPQDDPGDAQGAVEGEQGPSDYGRVVNLLCREYGQSPAYWFWSVPFDEVQALYQAYEERREAEFNRQSKKAGLSIAPNPDSHKIRSYQAFRAFVLGVAADRGKKVDL